MYNSKAIARHPFIEENGNKALESRKAVCSFQNAYQIYHLYETDDAWVKIGPIKLLLYTVDLWYIAATGE